MILQTGLSRGADGAEGEGGHEADRGAVAAVGEAGKQVFVSHPL